MEREIKLQHECFIDRTELCQITKCKDLKNDMTICLKEYEEDNRLVALKEIFINEKLIQKINYKSIVNYFGSFEKHNKINLMFEYSEYGHILQFNKSYPTLKEESYLRIFLIKLIEGLILIHKCGIIHNDIKGENILIFLDKECSIFYPKICDFNVSIIKKGNRFLPFCLRNDYSQIPFEKPSYKSDYFNLGILLYEILFNKLPFEITNISAIKTLKLFQKEQSYINYNNFILKDLIENLLEIDSQKRLGDKNIFQHSFFVSKIRKSLKIKLISIRRLDKLRKLLKQRKLGKNKMDKEILEYKIHKYSTFLREDHSSFK
jgi:serine/threonine protein kinase